MVPKDRRLVIPRLSGGIGRLLSPCVINLHVHIVPHRALACDTARAFLHTHIQTRARRILIFKAGVTVILCLVFIFRGIRRGNIQYIIARRRASATGYLSQYFIGTHIAISASGACRQRRNSDAFPPESFTFTRRKHTSPRSATFSPRVRSWTNVRHTIPNESEIPVSAVSRRQ